MKRAAIILVATLATSAMALAQAPAAQPKAPATGQQQPATTPAPGPGTAQAPAAASVRTQPKAQSQEEFQAYQAAASKPDPASAEQAADEFAQKYANSELRGPLYQRVMGMYQNANNGDKTVEVGHKLLAIDPGNGAALVTVAGVLANKTRETDLDKDERFAEARKDAQQALDLVAKGEGIPAGTPDEKVELYKELVRSSAYSALGTVEFNNKNFAKAEEYLRKSTEGQNIQQDPVSWLQLSLSLDRQNKFAEALQAANKCLEIANGSAASSYCSQERDRLTQLVKTPAPEQKPATPAPPSAAAPTTPKQ